MTNKTAELYQKVFEEFLKVHSERMKDCKTIYLRTDDETGQYSGIERACETFGLNLIHNLCFFHWSKLYRGKFETIDPKFFDFDENGSRCKNYKFFVIIKYLPLLSIQKI